MINYYLVIALMLSIIFGGYEHFAYKQYKAEIESMGKAQQIAVEATKKQQEIATKGIEDAYKSKIDAIRANYGRMHDPSSGNLPTISQSSITIDGEARNLLLDCALTTQQVMSLQDWIKEIAEIK